MNTFFNSELLIVDYNDWEKMLESGTILVDAYQLTVSTQEAGRHAGGDR